MRPDRGIIDAAGGGGMASAKRPPLGDELFGTRLDEARRSTRTPQRTSERAIIGLTSLPPQLQLSQFLAGEVVW